MISLIVPAHNEEGLIGATLDALHAAAAAANEPYEIIVVDDQSTDSTSELGLRGGARVLRVEHRQISAARNAGAARALGDLLVFVDADTLVPGSVLRAAVDAMRRGAVGGGAPARFDVPVPLYGRSLACSWRLLQRLTHWASGCFLFCTREAFEAVGGFDPGVYAAEDVVMSRRLKRLGRFVIVRGGVVTSGRTVRTHSAMEAFRILAGFILRGASFFRTRHGPWYEPRAGGPEPRG